MTIHKVALNWKGKMHFESEGPGGTVAIDGAEEFGGEGKGVRPKAMMLSALAGCAGMDISSLLKKMRAEVAHFSIDVEGVLLLFDLLIESISDFFFDILELHVWLLFWLLALGFASFRLAG